jgi:hypothetical protein
MAVAARRLAGRRAAGAPTEGRAVTQPAAPVPLKALQRQLKLLVDDLRDQSEALPELNAWLHGQYDAAYTARRTGGTYEPWRDEQVELAAVAWLLGTVFVRFCEDNHLVNGVWIGGPGGGVDAAVQAKTAYFQENFRHNDRHWLRHAFEHLRKLRATAALFDEHNPVWRFDISADAAAALLDFWQRGAGLATFRSLDTRFLGDLYQDLSQDARKRYALLQTPEFVEEFILNLTLDESLREYGLADTSLIDPTCGSGHFLLGAFRRLHARWLRDAPNMDPRERVQKALDQVTGVDINPFAVAIARFRLLVKAMQACGETSLETAPGFRIRLATGDSLLKWGREESSHQGDMLAAIATGNAFAYFTEDADLLANYLRPGQYTVVVGNPPYITVKDKALNQRYRATYDACYREYALSVPFAQRFFSLARSQRASGRAGFVGQITANSFMKRDFGRKLIEEFFTHKVELDAVIDASGVRIADHGTPTVILIGRNRLPLQGLAVRTAMARRSDPPGFSGATGPTWRAIVAQLDHVGSDSEWISVRDVPRSQLAVHPWSLRGGGATELFKAIAAGQRIDLGSKANEIGLAVITGEDAAFVVNRTNAIVSRRIPIRAGAEGTDLRDWTLSKPTWLLSPYDEAWKLAPAREILPLLRFLWPVRELLYTRKRFGVSLRNHGAHWYEWREIYRSKLHDRWIVSWPLVATHNHFYLQLSPIAFKHSAPVATFDASVGEGECVGLLGLLNSSTACFWMKQVCHDKGSGGIGGGVASEDWERFYEFNPTRMCAFPISNSIPTIRSKRMNQLADNLGKTRPDVVFGSAALNRERLNQARADHDKILGKMIAIQEELDWEVYRLYGLVDEDLTAPEECLPVLRLGERAFEIILARKMARGEVETQWFARHGSTPITEIPERWPAPYKAMVERRIRVIEERSDIALIERPECKRRWAAKPWEVQEKDALRDWLLDRLEGEHLWREAGRARVLSVAQLADRIGADAEFRSVLALYCGREDYDLAAELTKLTASEAVPFFAAYRYKPSGLAKRRQWEETWDLQRREDAGEEVGRIPVPPKYKSEDFARKSYWDNRGKLDVPKERFVLYPKAGRDTDKTPVLGWAGWDHLDQAQALATLYYDRKSSEGWDAGRLLPLLAGLVELEPWLRQWHAEPAPAYPSGPAAFYTQVVIDTELAALGRGRADLTAEKLS